LFALHLFSYATVVLTLVAVSDFQRKCFNLAPCLGVCSPAKRLLGNTCPSSGIKTLKPVESGLSLQQKKDAGISY